ncbi:MAG: O-antigen ligase family protein [Anaerolineae bacterium]
MVNTSPVETGNSQSPHSTSKGWRPILGVILYALGLIIIVLSAYVVWTKQEDAIRSHGYGLPPDVPQATVNPFGVNVALKQYDEAELEQALGLIEAGGFQWVRQTFPWADIEAQAGQYDWAAWDRIVTVVREHNLNLIAVLDTSPGWAQPSPEAAYRYSPPQEIADFGRFAQAFARRYREEIDYYQIWDEPNLSSHWGNAYVDPADYAHLLREGYIQVRSADPSSFVLMAGLAPNSEGGPLNLNEVAFLRGLYAAGADDYFDIVAVKPYGFDTGPDDRQVNSGILNFSRIQLVQEAMIASGGENKALWAVEFGWNALPPGWQGQPSIWGQVSEEEQAHYTVAAIERARDEWPWLGVLAVAHFQPDAPPDDPHWGFALVDEQWKPRPVYQRLRDLATAPPIAYPGRYPADHYTARYLGDWRLSPRGADIGKTGDSLVIPFKGTRLDLTVRRGDFWGILSVTVDGKPANRLPRDSQGHSYLVLHDPLSRTETVTLASGLADEVHEAELVAEGGWGQWAIVGWTVAREPNLLPYRLAWALLGICAVVLLVASSKQLAASYHLLPAACSLLKQFVGRYHDMPEGLQLAITLATALVFYFAPWPFVSLLALALLAISICLRLDIGLALVAFSIPFFLYPKHILGMALSMVEIATLLCLAAWLLKTSIQLPTSNLQPPASSLDFAVIFFVALSAFSLLIAENFGVAMREFRVVVFESALFYFLLRATPLARRHLWRIVEALILAAVIVSLIGLYQYFFTSDVITAEGVRRIHGVYGSPNNLGLFLGRIVPILAAVTLFGSSLRRRAIYCLIGLPVALCLYLTYSRGAWLLGLPAAFIFLGLMRGKKTLLIALLAILVIALSLLPLIGTERLASLFNTQSGTTFLRLKLWQGSLNMIRDHPLFGVGLDNFLYQYRTRYVLPEAWEELDLSHPHNIILDYWTRLGILGVIAIGWLQFAFFRKALRLHRQLGDRNLKALLLGLMASMVAFLAHGLIDNSYFLVDLAFVFCLTLGVVARVEEPGGNEGKD